MLNNYHAAIIQPLIRYWFKKFNYYWYICYKYNSM